MDHLEAKFEKMGARLKVRQLDMDRIITAPPQVNIQSDKDGEYFDIALGSDSWEVVVIDVRPKQRHLLLMLKELGEGGEKGKILCGHDETHWFAAPVANASRNVDSAIENLKPPDIREEQDRKGTKRKNRNKRRNDTFVRQGEWFFTHTPDLQVDEKMVHHNEPLSRGGGSSPHMMEFCYRRGGQAVMVHPTHARLGIGVEKWHALDDKIRQAGGWNRMTSNAEVFAKGRISHRDHYTITLPGWHRVAMNEEQKAAQVVRQAVTFLD